VLWGAWGWGLGKSLKCSSKNKTESTDLAAIAALAVMAEKHSNRKNPLQIQSSQLEEWHSLDAFQLGLMPFYFDLRNFGFQTLQQLK
jgi:hypothetical protein